MDKLKSNMKFIRANTLETANKLRSWGFTEISESNVNTFLFLNDGKMLFELNETDYVCTNKLCI